jgi:plasmid segregation protein ParM
MVAIQCMKKWKRNDEVYIVGGNADGLLVPMLYHFPNAKTLKPQISENGSIKLLQPVFANAVAFYNIAKKVYGDGIQH